MANQPPLFDSADVPPASGDADEPLPAGAPLAARMRPRTLGEFVGQAPIVGPGTALRAAIEAGRCPSLASWGPPGSGKTTLARLLASATSARFIALSAVAAGVSDLRRAVADARRSTRGGHSTVLFIDEIHRLNKAQQDAVLPAVERGDVVLIGATTENPSFEVNNALLSRARVVVLAPLRDEDIGTILDRTLTDARGLSGRFTLTADGRAAAIAAAGGDARVALNALELASEVAAQRGDGTISAADVEAAMQRRALRYDRTGDEHYDVISAFIKSMRGSDPDASVYWLARMLEAGEDPMFVARRLVILAAEDVGLADPAALGVATAAHYATHVLGMPEARYPLAEATLYLARAPKSDAVGRAYFGAAETVEQRGALPVPLHLRNAVTGLERRLGYGKGYQYAHDMPDARVEHAHLPDEIGDKKFFEPGPRDR